MVQVFVLSTPRAAMTAVAAIDAGLIAAAGARILVAADRSPVPEIADGIERQHSLQPLWSRFDRIVRLGDLLAPTLPSQWMPRADDLPLLERLLRAEWGIGSEPVELFLQSPDLPPARALLTAFAAAPFTVIGDGLAAYGPPRRRLSRPLSGRALAVVYPDTVPGLRPVMFTEVGALAVPVLLAAVEGLVDADAGPPPPRPLAQLTPFEHPDRIPATIVDALARPDAPYRDPARLQALIDAVSYCLRPRTVAHLRVGAEELLSGLDEAERDRYFDAERLARLDLLPDVARAAGSHRRPRSAMNEVRRRARRAWKELQGR